MSSDQLTIAFDSNGMRPKTARHLGPWRVESDSLTIRIPIRNRFTHTGIDETLIDVRDYALAMSRQWHVTTPGYATSGGAKQIALHNAIMQPEKGLEVDHVHGDLLDNRRNSLRVGTKSQNVANRRRPARNRLGNPIGNPFRGVKKDRKRWLALITHNGKQHYIGTYRTPERAALAYDVEARRRFGEFARLNFPHLQPQDTPVNRTVSFALEKETKGAVRYTEIDGDGKPIDQGESCVGTLYIRKSAITGSIPQRVTITIADAA